MLPKRHHRIIINPTVTMFQRLNKTIAALIGAILVSSISLQAENAIQLTQQWESDRVLMGPEAVAYDAVRDVLYVSNVNLNSPKGDEVIPHEEFISKVTTNGKIIDLKWIDHINRPTGMVIHQDKLYVSERGALVIINIEKESVEARIPIADTGFVNDVTISPDGVAYMTDSGKGTVYRIENGKPEAWLVSEEIGKPNGLLFDGDKLIIGVNTDNYLKSIDLKTKEVKKIAFLGEGGIDGILPYKNGYIASLVKGNIFYVKKEGFALELLNTREEDLKIADFEYIPSQQLLIAPIINKEYLIGYQLQ